MIAPVKVVNEGVESDLFNVGECVSFPWFPFTQTASHQELVGRFIQKLIDDIENDVDVMGKVKKNRYGGEQCTYRNTSIISVKA